MTWWTRLRTWFRGKSPRRTPAPLRTTTRSFVRARLTVETLEDRLALSTLLGPDLEYAAWREQTFRVDHIEIANALTPKLGIDTAVLDAAFAPSTQASGFENLIGLGSVNASYNYRGQGYAVAVIDTGIDYRHSALGGGWGNRVIAGYDFVNNDADPLDDNGHGTHVAGIIGSSSSSYPGVAPSVNLIALKVLGADGSGSFGDVEDALRWVINNRERYNIVAVNLSLGSGNYTSNPYSFLEDEFSSLKANGVFLAAASGNSFYSYSSQQGVGYPSISPNVVAVGAVFNGSYGAVTWSSGARDHSSASDRITSFTQRSSALDILAPGAFITSARLNGGSQSMAGTSMATPVVTGAAVLLHQALDSLGQSTSANQDYILSLMTSTAKTLADGDDENDNVTNTGLSFKRLDLYAALQSLQQANVAPTLAPIGNLVLNIGSTLHVPLQGADVNGDPLTYSARFLGTAPPVALGITGNTLVIQSLGDFSGSFTIEATVSDGRATASRTFSLRANHAPITSPIAAQNMRASQDRLTIPLIATDPDGDSLTYAGRIATASAQAVSLQQSLGLRIYSTTHGYFTNSYGLGEKWIYSNSGTWYAIFSNGELRRWSGTTPVTLNNLQLVATLDASYYIDPELLWNASNRVALPAVSVSVSGNQVAIDPAAGFLGSFIVEATASDGQAVSREFFTVTVANTAPTLGAIANQTMSAAQDRLTVALPGSDADGDPLTYSARAVVSSAQAVNLQQSLGLRLYSPTHGYFTNSYGLGEKWIYSNSGVWYALFANGELRRWSGTTPVSLANLQLVATLDPSYFLDPELLWNASSRLAAPPVAFSLAGNQATVDPSPGYSGTFLVEAMVSDGVASSRQYFTVSITNTAPTLAPVAGVAMSTRQDRLTIGLSGSDADGDPLTYAARVFTADAQAVQLQQSLGLRLYSTTHGYFTNSYGLGEKWIYSNSGTWYCLLANGELRRWSGTGAVTLANLQLVASLDAAYYLDPELLWNAASRTTPANVVLTTTGSQLTIDPAAGYVGSIVIEASVSDGQAVSRRTFTVNVTP